MPYDKTDPIKPAHHAPGIKVDDTFIVICFVKSYITKTKFKKTSSKSSPELRYLYLTTSGSGYIFGKFIYLFQQLLVSLTFVEVTVSYGQIYIMHMEVIITYGQMDVPIYFYWKRGLDFIVIKQD